MPPPVEVAVAAAETRQMERALALTGSLLPDETVNLSAEVAGTLAQLFVDFGQPVRKGLIVAELDKRELNLQAERARAALSQAMARIGLSAGQEEANPDSTPALRQAIAQLEDARFKFESAERLVQSGDISRERYTELEKGYRAREAAVQAARDELRTQLAWIQGLRADWKLAQKHVADATVRAPFDGAVTARLASPGEFVKEHAPLLTLVKSSPLRVRVEIPEPDVGDVRIGTQITCTTEAAPGRQFRALVRELNPSLDARSRSLTAEARLLDADPRLKPGMFVQVRLVSKKVEVVVVPKAAVYSVAGLSKVYAIRDGRAVECKLEGAPVAGDWVEAPAALIRPGDKVAVSNLALLVHGAPVAIKS
ncbi:MAG: efflux RND transporter periplasmic adaptor subunit [Candidatus Solibacter usitatus]|nr:efflux RND transporter periplasmic adaptor subunit [Candidatus Solibacter usitatus]